MIEAPAEAHFQGCIDRVRSGRAEWMTLDDVNSRELVESLQVPSILRPSLLLYRTPY